MSKSRHSHHHRKSFSSSHLEYTTPIKNLIIFNFISFASFCAPSLVYFFIVIFIATKLHTKVYEEEVIHVCLLFIYLYFCVRTYKPLTTTYWQTVGNVLVDHNITNRGIKCFHVHWYCNLQRKKEPNYKFFQENLRFYMIINGLLYFTIVNNRSWI